MLFRCTLACQQASLLSITHNETIPPCVLLDKEPAVPGTGYECDKLCDVHPPKKSGNFSPQFGRVAHEVVCFKAFQSQSSGRMLNTFFRPPTLVSRMQCQMASIWHPLTCCFQSSGAVQQYHKRVKSSSIRHGPAEILDLLSISISMPVTEGICFHPKSIATS